MSKYFVRPNNITILHLISFFAALYFYLPIMTLYLQGRGLNLFQVNSLWGIIVGTMFLTEVPTGMLADKIGRRKSIIIALALQLLGEVIYIFAARYWMFAFVSVIAGLGFSFASGSFEAFLYDTLKRTGREEEMAKVMGLNGAFAQAAFIIGPLIGGFLIADFALKTFILLIILTAISVSLALLVSFFLQEPEMTADQTRPNSLQLLRDSLILIKNNQSLQKLIWLTLLGTPFLEYLVNLYQPYFIQANVSHTWFGVAFALGSAAALLATKYAYRVEDIFGVKNGLLLVTLLPSLFYFLMAGIFQPTLSVTLLIIAWGSMKLREPLLSHYRNRHISSENRATVLSLISMISGLYTALMGLLIGRLADYTISYSFLFMGLIVFISTLIFKFIFKIDTKDVQAKKPGF